MNTKNIKEIRYFRRDPKNIESIASLRFQFEGKNSTKNGLPFSKEEKEKLFSTLFDTLKIQDTPEEYRAFLYEGDKENYAIKFFLSLKFKDQTYFAIKGTKPFQQPNYKEIVSSMEPYFDPKVMP